MTPFANATIRTHRRWVVFECPEHGIVDAVHVTMDPQCPVATKGVLCTHDLVGPITVEEVHGGEGHTQ